MNKTVKTLAIVALAAVTLQACAKRASAIAPAVVPTANYEGYDCDELKTMLAQKTASKNALVRTQNNAATMDSVAIWFTLLPLGTVFGMDREGEVAQVKGETMALQGLSKKPAASAKLFKICEDGRHACACAAVFIGDPGWIRTTGPQIRNLVLYPTELRDHRVNLTPSARRVQLLGLSVAVKSATNNQ